jgi:RND family efflux transporter MFP subunit
VAQLKSFALVALIAIIFSGLPQSFTGSYPSALAQSTGTDAKKSTTDKKTGGKKKKRRSATLVQVDKVHIVPMVQTVPLVGRLVAVRSGVVAARIDAPVEEMKVDVGTSVKKGGLIAILANDRLKWEREQKAAELAGAVAAVDTANARLALAEQELRRFAELRDSAAFPRARFEDKRVDVNRLRTEIVEAKSKVEKARATLRLAETDLSYTRIRAPYDGTITRRHTETGAYIKEGQAIFTMVSDTNLEIEVDVPANRITYLKPGVITEFQLGRTGKRYQAVLRAIVPEEDLRTRTRTVRFLPRFDQRPPTLAANQSATVHLPIGQGRKILSVHKDALVSARGQPTVYVVEDGRAQARVIKIGDAVGPRFEVLEGLKDGEDVVVRGNERLRDGRRVRVSKAAAQ